MGTGLPFKPGHRDDIEIFLDEEMLLAPMRWKKPKMVFVCSMTDLFADFVKDEWIDRVFAVMIGARHHTFQVLTKRSARMRSYLNGLTCAGGFRPYVHRPGWKSVDQRDGDKVFLLGETQTWPLPDCWLGVACEDQRRADERVPDLLATPAAVRFVSAEPLLSGIDFRHIGGDNYLNSLSSSTGPNIDWIIVGGESGPGARPMVVGDARDIVRQCREAGASVFVKQLGARPVNREGVPHPLKNRKGGDMAEWPEDLRVREYPEIAR